MKKVMMLLVTVTGSVFGVWLKFFWIVY